jgi:hypothetical protein
VRIPLPFETAVEGEGLIAVKPIAAKKPAAKKATGRKKK